MKLQIEALAKHKLAIFKQTKFGLKSGAPKPNGPWYSDCSPRRHLCFIKAECSVCTPDYHKNMTGLPTDMYTQIKALQNTSLSFKDRLSSWFTGGLWSTIKGLFVGLLILIAIWILIRCLFQSFSAWCQDSITTITSCWQMVLTTHRDTSLISTLDFTASTFPNSAIQSWLINVESLGRDIFRSLFSRKMLQKMRPSTFNNLKDLRVRIVQGARGCLGLSVS